MANRERILKHENPQKARIMNSSDRIIPMNFMARLYTFLHSLCVWAAMAAVSLCLMQLASFSLGASAALPTAFFHPSPPAVTGATITVCSSGCTYTTVQAAWNAASGGDEIVLTAGETFSVNGNVLVMSNKAGSSYITIRSSASCKATGNRVGSADLANMATLKTTQNSAYVITNDDGNATLSARAAHHVYFKCLNVTLDSSVAINFALMFFSPGVGNNANPVSMPHDIIIDRCWIHTDHLGNSSGTDAYVRGVFEEGSNLAIINNRIEGFLYSGVDTQAIAIVGGPGPVYIANNYLDACTEDVMTGGASSSDTNQVQDLEIAFNYFNKQIGCLTTSGSTAKNLLELKTGVRVWIHDNLMENGYETSGSQHGSCFLLSNRPAQSGYGNYEANVRVVGNLCRHAGELVTTNSLDNYCNDFNSTVNVSGTNFTITAGVQGLTSGGGVNAQVVLLNGVANTVTNMTSTTTGTLGTSGGTQTGVSLLSIYHNCNNQTDTDFINNIGDDLDRTYVSAGNDLAQLSRSIRFFFQNNTLITGSVVPITVGVYGTAFTDGACMNPVTAFYDHLTVDKNIFVPDLTGSGGYNSYTADCYNSPNFLVAPQASSPVLTSNITVGTNSPSLTDWNTIGSGNVAPANLAAVGLLSDHKALDPMSAYFSTGAGANLETCFDETAIRNGTPVATQCDQVAALSNTPSARHSGSSRRFSGSRN